VTGAERYTSDAKDYDITGAMFVMTMEKLINMLFSAGIGFGY
jgi:hypothetical protein